MKLLHSLTAALIVCAAPAMAQDSPLASSANQIAENRTEVQVPKCPITEAQRQKLHALRDQFELDTAQTRAQLIVSGRQLFDLLSAPTVDKSAVLSLHSKINSLRNSLSDSRIKLMLALDDVFTPAQREEMRSKMHHHHCGHHWGYRHECESEDGAAGASCESSDADCEMHPDGMSFESGHHLMPRP